MKIFQLHPTLLCHQDCAWCPYHSMHEDKEIPLAEIQRQLGRYRSTCDILKISGGGSPLLYSDFDALLFLARQLGYKIYLQTENNPLLNDFVRGYCHDIRVSFGDGVPFLPPLIPVDGLSYVVSANPEYENLNAVINYALEHNHYVRVTQDDTDLANIPTIEEIKSHIPPTPFTKGVSNTIHAGTSEADRLSGKSPYPLYTPFLKGGRGDYKGGNNLRFWDALDYHQGKNPCPCYASPLLTPLGWFPCCKTHVAKGLAAGYNQAMSLGVEYPQTPYDGSGCSRCYY